MTVTEFTSHSTQPGETVLIGEGSPCRHLRNILRRVQCIPIKELTPKALRKGTSHGRLAAPRNPHHNNVLW